MWVWGGGSAQVDRSRTGVLRLEVCGSEDADGGRRAKAGVGSIGPRANERNQWLACSRAELGSYQPGESCNAPRQSAGTRRKTPKCPAAMNAILGLTPGFICSLFLLVFVGACSSEKSWWSEEMINLKYLGWGLLDYSESHQGAFPDSLYTFRMSLEPGVRDNTYFRDRQAGHSYDWLYFNPPVKTPSRGAIVAAAPRPSEHRKRLVLFDDASVMFIEDSEFTDLLGTRAR